MPECHMQTKRQSRPLVFRSKGLRMQRLQASPIGDQGRHPTFGSCLQHVVIVRGTLLREGADSADRGSTPMLPIPSSQVRRRWVADGLRQS